MKASATLVACLAVACGGHRHDHDDDHGHEVTERSTIVVTRWTSMHEVFTEYPAFIVGQPSRLAAHVTRLADHRPVTAGKVTATLSTGSNAPVAAEAGAPTRPGIFQPELVPVTAGPCTLTLVIDDGTQREDVTTECVVHAASAPLPPEPDEPPGRITFLKEAAWSSDLATELVGQHELVPTLRTTGELRATTGREAKLTATAHGRVVLEGVPVLGTTVTAGQVLARIVPQVESTADRVSLSADDQAARTELAAAETALARAERLWEARTIALKDLEEARTRLRLARVRTQAATTRLGQFDAGAAGRTGGRTRFQVRSPLAGTLVAIHVSSGQSVEDGDPLFTIVDLSRVWLHADVFEPDLGKVESATRASFRVDGHDTPIEIAPPDGHVVTLGQVVDARTRTVPMIFELSNPDQRLRIGAFATVWIETGAPVTTLAIPETAIVDDAGKKVVYVQVEGERFERRPVTLGIRSGGHVEVRDGLSRGDRVVVRGAYDIKLASAGASIPEHGHAH